MYKFILTVLMLCFIFGAQPISADMFTPSHYCSKPYKPYDFADEWAVQRFKDDVETYQSCIEDFVEEQRNAIKKHQKAAAEAIDEWNNFVDYELR